jgi:calpain-15
MRRSSTHEVGLSSYVSKVIHSKQPFTDSDFPPNENSLLDKELKNGGLDAKSAEFFSKIVWRRASELYDGICEVFKKDVQPNDVAQGKLGDCYFLSALSALAECPGRIESMFNTKTFNEAGIYSVNFWVNGQVKEVIVDDYIPVSPDTKLPCFAYSNQSGEIWAMIIEKAWAKLHGSYCLIRTGTAAQALSHLTGAPTKRFDHNFVGDAKAFWD